MNLTILGHLFRAGVLPICRQDTTIIHNLRWIAYLPYLQELGHAVLQKSVLRWKNVRRLLISEHQKHSGGQSSGSNSGGSGGNFSI